MKSILHLVLLLAVALSAHGSPLADNIKVEAMIVTKAELHRHLSAGDSDRFRPATYAELAASRGAGQPDYLVMRFLELKPGHYSGEVEARIDHNANGIKQTVTLHFNKDWVDYFIPLDGFIYGVPGRPGSPAVSVSWNRLEAK